MTNKHSEHADRILNQLKAGMDYQAADLLAQSAQVRATQGLVYEQRTANLIAYAATLREDRDGTLCQQVDDEIQARLGLA